MSITGIFLILFLVIHVSVNACIWASGEVFNKAAHWLGATAVPRVLEIGLFLFIILHIVQGLVLAAENNSRRGTAYAINYGSRGSTWYSRSMGLLGTLILLFLILHLADFWIPSRFGGLGTVTYDGKEYHDLYGKMIAVFQNPVIVIIYVLGCISLAYHLAHGFQSAFRTLGVHNRRYQNMLANIGYVFTIIVTIAFIMMPVSIYFEWVK